MAVGLSHPFRSEQKHPSRLFEPTGPGRLLYQVDHQVLHLVEIVSLLFIEDDEVGAQTLHAPVLLRIEQLAYEWQRRRIANSHKHDRQIARDALAPEVLLAVAIDRQIRRTQHRVVGPEYARRESIVEDGVFIAQTKVLQRC